METEAQLQYIRKRTDTAERNVSDLSIKLAKAEKTAADQRAAFKTKEAIYQVVTFVTLLYGAVITALAAMHNTYFLQGMTDFGTGFLSGLAGIWRGLDQIAGVAGQMGYAIDDGILGSILYWILYGAVISSIAYGIWTGLRRSLPRVRLWARKNLTDRVSVTIFLIAFAVIVFLAEPLSATPLNIVVWMLLIDGGYVAIIAIRKKDCF